ncbi:hypothetical protein ACJU26_01295 [Acidithiobacillus sp. M4-SHS-6]|uniref:hypothetical protein n=1 Tax=Acidithiobacillus sp. M4-SHS-6 TaxID=3383024 RepID=UPI0039BE790E
MNWGSILSAVVGAVTGGIFLLVGQRYIAHESHEKAKRIVLLESLRNLESLIENVKTIEQNKNPLGVQVTLNVKIDAFLRYEEDLMSNRLDEFQKISELISKIQIAKLKSQWWMPRMDIPEGAPVESKKTLNELIVTCSEFVKILSKRVRSHELRKIHKAELVENAGKSLEALEKSQQAFMLVPPYEEWPYPMTSTINQEFS